MPGESRLCQVNPV